MDHSSLIAELPEIERMTPFERIALARQRREQQLLAYHERERCLPIPPPRRPRLKFSPEVALLEATVRGDLQEVERLLRESANPNSHNEDGLTPLHQCAIDNNEAIMRLLLRYGADVNCKDTELWTPLHAAAVCGYLEIVRLLIAHNADFLAVNADGNMPYDITDDEPTLDLIESEMANQGITQQRIDERRGQPEKEMLDDMKFLHQRGLPLDSRMPDGSTYLHVAASNGFYEVAAFLLRCGVRPNVRDNDSWMPVHAAASWNQSDIIELLCEYGADIAAKTRTGETPIDLTEDEQTQRTIRTIAQNEARRKRLAFGVRDSRRQSRRRKKFESPQQLAVPSNSTVDNPFSARGTIRRASLRDRSGMTPARLEAQMENSDLIRSWSKEDVSSDPPPTAMALLGSDGQAYSQYLALCDQQQQQMATPGLSSVFYSHQQQRPPTRDSPKRNSAANVSQPPGGGRLPHHHHHTSASSSSNKPLSPDEWLRKLEDSAVYHRDDDEDGRQRDDGTGGAGGHSDADQAAAFRRGGPGGTGRRRKSSSSDKRKQKDCGPASSTGDGFGPGNNDKVEINNNRVNSPQGSAGSAGGVGISLNGGSPNFIPLKSSSYAAASSPPSPLHSRKSRLCCTLM